MSSNVEIRVTADDIAQGVRGDVDRCPVALAASRRLKKLVRVDDACLLIDYGGVWMHRQELPDRVWNWVVDFDTSVPVRPLRFKVPARV